MSDEERVRKHIEKPQYCFARPMDVGDSGACVVCGIGIVTGELRVCDQR